MDFSRVELSKDDESFRDDLRSFLNELVTDEVIQRDRETGENFDEGVHLALGEAGYLAADFKAEADGGFTRVRKRIWDLEIGRARTPWFHWGTTAMVARAVQQFGSPELKDEILERTLAGHFRLCLGYTEPEGGSDVATCKTRAVRDGDGWIINGSKMFTSNAHNASYVFLVTNTDPDAPKHQSLTMFLVPLDSPGVEIQALRTVDGDRTNITYYSDVRIDDRYRIGEVNGGWTVLREALNDEHGTVERDDDGLQKVAVMSEHVLLLAEALDKVAALAADEDSVEVPVGPRRGPPRGGDEHARHVRPRRKRADDARCRTGSDGHPRRRVEPARRREGCGRRRRRRVRLPTGGPDRDLRRHARGVPEHDRPARTRARQAELLAAEGHDDLSGRGQPALYSETGGNGRSPPPLFRAAKSTS